MEKLCLKFQLCHLLKTSVSSSLYISFLFTVVDQTAEFGNFPQQLRLTVHSPLLKPTKSPQISQEKSRLPILKHFHRPEPPNRPLLLHSLLFSFSSFLFCISPHPPPSLEMHIDTKSLIDIIAIFLFCIDIFIRYIGICKGFH